MAMAKENSMQNYTLIPVTVRPGEVNKGHFWSKTGYRIKSSKTDVQGRVKKNGILLERSRLCTVTLGHSGSPLDLRSIKTFFDCRKNICAVPDNMPENASTHVNKCIPVLQ